MQRSRRVSPEEKALRHHTGARPFFGLTDPEMTQIGARLQRAITGSLRRQGVPVADTGT